MITGALQADTAHIMVPAAGNSITVIALDHHKAGKIHGQRLDSISRLINLGSEADLHQQTYQRKQTRATESTPKRHLATARWTALGAGSQRRYSRATPRRMMRVSFQRCSTAHESRNAEGLNPDLERGRQACAFVHKHARYCRTVPSVAPRAREQRTSRSAVACQLRAALPEGG